MSASSQTSAQRRAKLAAKRQTLYIMTVTEEQVSSLLPPSERELTLFSLPGLQVRLTDCIPRIPPLTRHTSQTPSSYVDRSSSFETALTHQTSVGGFKCLWDARFAPGLFQLQRRKNEQVSQRTRPDLAR